MLDVLRSTRATRHDCIRRWKREDAKLPGYGAGLLLALQAFQVALLLTHDWVPLGRLNDVAAIRKQDSPTRLLFVTLVQTLPFAIGLVFSALATGSSFPGWLRNWLWISYGILFAGEVTAWWIPYVFTASASRVARYRAMFAGTHAFLPARHGIRPNTLHVVLHAATAMTLLVLGLTS